MIPKFDSQMSMINYFKGLEGQDFTKLLKDEFDMDAPADAPSYQREYLFKYMIQGMTFHNKQGDDLIKYAVERTQNLVKTQPHLLSKGEPVRKEAVIKTAKTSKVRVVKDKQPDGTVIFLEHRQVWVGYFNGKIQCSKKTEAAAKKFLQDKFGA